MKTQTSFVRIMDPRELLSCTMGAPDLFVSYMEIENHLNHSRKSLFARKLIEMPIR